MHNSQQLSPLVSKSHSFLDGSSPPGAPPPLPWLVLVTRGQSLREGSRGLIKPQIHAGTTLHHTGYVMIHFLASACLGNWKHQEAKVSRKWSLNNSKPSAGALLWMPVPVRCLKFSCSPPLHRSFSRKDGMGEMPTRLWCSCADHVITIRLLPEARVCAQGGEQTRREISQQPKWLAAGV